MMENKYGGIHLKDVLKVAEYLSEKAQTTL